MSLISATINGQNNLFSVCNLHCIESVGGQTTVFFKTAGMPPVVIAETVAQIFAQQNTTGKNLGMLLLTRREDGNQVIYFTEVIDKIVRVTKPITDPVGTAPISVTTTEVVFSMEGKFRSGKVDVNEDLATIMAMQSTNKELMLMQVTERGTGISFIINRKLVSHILPDSTGSKIIYHTIQTTMLVTESPAAIFSALPQ